MKRKEKCITCKFVIDVDIGNEDLTKLIESENSGEKCVNMIIEAESLKQSKMSKLDTIWSKQLLL